MKAILIIRYITSGLAFIFVISSCHKPLGESIKNKAEILPQQQISNPSDSSSITLLPSLENAKKDVILASNSHNDTLLVKSQIVLGSVFRLHGNTDEAVTLFRKAFLLSEKIMYEQGACQSLIESGIVIYEEGQYEKSGELFRKALEIARQKRILKLEATALNYIGKYLHTTGHFEESVLYYNQAIEIYKSNGNLQQSATVLLSLGKTFTNDGNLYMALKCYLEAFETCEKTNDYLNLADVCNHLGTIYFSLEQPDKSMDYHQRALAYRVALKTPKGMANSSDNIGKVFLKQNKPDSAKTYFLKALKYSEQINYMKGNVKALNNLGKLNNIQLNYNQAKIYLNRSYYIATKSGYDAGIAEASLELGDTFLGLHQPDSAKQSFESCLEKAKSANLTQLNHDGYWGLYQSYLFKQDYKKSLDNYILFTQAEKKLLLAQEDYRLSELRVAFETEKKEKDNEVLRKNNELKELAIRHKNTLIVLFIAALAFTIVLMTMFYFRFENKKKANRRLEQLNNQITQKNIEFAKLNKELEKANREKDKIFSIITHELRNPLYWFQNLTEMLSIKYHTMPPEKVQKTLEALDESAKNAFHLMDNLMHWSRSRLNRITPVIGEHSLEKLIHESCRMYETILRQKNISLMTDLPKDSLIKADADLFMCVIRNLVSNAIKFTPENGYIEISTRREVQNYIISISDSGIGIDPKQRKTIFNSKVNSFSEGLMNEKGSGFGLKLCKEFVKMNGGKIWLADNSDVGSRFCFIVPIANKKNMV